MLKLDHAVFPIWDVEASLAFYRDVMGFSLTGAASGDDWGGRPWLMMTFAVGDGREIALVHLRGAHKPADDGLPDDVRHVAFAETAIEALGDWRARLRDCRIAFREEDHGARRSLYFHDPNGVTLEITAPPSHSPAAPDADALAAVEAWLADARAPTD